jgi:hypothetical protein
MLPGNFKLSNLITLLIDGFAEMFAYVCTLGHSDKPDYDRIIKYLTKGKSRFESKDVSKNYECVDSELFENDPLFQKFDQALFNHVITQSETKIV